MWTNIIGIGTAGLILLFMEMFVPGMIAGTAGGVLLIVAVVMAYSDIGTGAGNLTLLTSIVAASTMWWWWAKYFQRTRFGRMMTLESSSKGDAVGAGFAELVGLEGKALTTLRPGGTVVVNGHRVDAMTDGEFIERDEPIVVLRPHGNTVVVGKAKKAQGA